MCDVARKEVLGINFQEQEFKQTMASEAFCMMLAVLSSEKPKRKKKTMVTFPVSASSTNNIIPLCFTMFIVVHGRALCAPIDQCLEEVVEGKKNYTLDFLWDVVSKSHISTHWGIYF